MCKVLKVSRSSYYHWLHDPEGKQEQTVYRRHDFSFGQKRPICLHVDKKCKVLSIGLPDH
ncbi:MAG: hypothetical protein JJE45_06715 [Prolixibacteraceae bacterium]|nr:hypothetical protein [Prolixibacteraceae bacterium]